jgi:hypothetical protein
LILDDQDESLVFLGAGHHHDWQFRVSTKMAEREATGRVVHATNNRMTAGAQPKTAELEPLCFCRCQQQPVFIAGNINAANNSRVQTNGNVAEPPATTAVRTPH